MRIEEEEKETFRQYETLIEENCPGNPRCCPLILLPKGLTKTTFGPSHGLTPRLESITDFAPGPNAEL